MDEHDEPIGRAVLGDEPIVDVTVTAETHNLRSVPIALYQGEERVKQAERWRLGVAYEHGRDTWGLVLDGLMTHMCYTFEHAPPIESVRNLRTQRQTSWWVFDVGNEIQVKLDDLEEAFQQLHVWEPADDSA